MNTKDTSGVLGFLREITPLEFDPGLSGDYIQALLSDEGRPELEGELSELYDGLAKEDRKERLRTMELIGKPHDPIPADLVPAFLGIPLASKELIAGVAGI